MDNEMSRRNVICTRFGSQPPIMDGSKGQTWLRGNEGDNCFSLPSRPLEENLLLT